jgi:hypothetical protein
MNHPRREIGSACLGLLAGLVLAAWSPAAEAQVMRGAVIGFNNKTKISISIEAVSTVRGKLVLAQPLQIDPKKVAWHVNVPPGKRFIQIYETNKPGKLLFKGIINVNQNFFFDVKMVENQKNPQVKLVPSNPPKAQKP